MCTCYNRLHWRWFGYVSPSYYTMWHHWFLHVLGFYWTTCRFSVVPHVGFLLAQVSCCRWITCHFFIGPCVIFLLVHVSVSYSTTCLLVFLNANRKIPQVPGITVVAFTQKYSGYHIFHKERVIELPNLYKIKYGCPCLTCWRTHTFTYINPIVHRVSRRTSVNQHHNQDHMIKQIHITYTEFGF